MIQIWILSALIRSSQILFLLFLPIFYHEWIINEIQIGYLWTLLLIWALLWSYVSATYLSRYSAKTLLLGAVFLCIIANAGIFVHAQVILILAYSIVGFGTGIGTASVSNIQYKFTNNADRFGKLANISMLGDIARISYPIIVGILYKFLWLTSVQLLSLVLWIGLFIFIKYGETLKTLSSTKSNWVTSFPIKHFIKNKQFVFTSIVEFLDGFSSSQLFVFLPLLLTYKWIIFENALLFQSTIFLGYFCGRWIIARIATFYNGYNAIIIAEIGMALSIIWIIAISSPWLVGILCFLLGICTRGTSPVIKWLAFNTLKPEESASGSAIHVFIWNAADICGQFAFGMLFATIGIYSTFWLSGMIAILLAIICIVRARNNV